MNQQDIRKVLTKLSLGRAYIETRADYYASTLYEMTVEVVDTPGVTMGITKGLVLYVNAEWILTDPAMQTDEVVGACLIHECEHPLRGMDRLEALPNKQLANIAGDLAINSNLRAEGWQLPPWVFYPERFGFPEGLTLERYYELLQQELANQQQSVQDMMDKSSAKDKSPSSGKGKPDKKSSDGSGSGSGKWEPKIGAGACGSGGGSAVDEALEKELDAAYGKSPSEVESVRRQTLDAIEEAVNSPGCGDIPARFKEMIKDRYKKPDVNWRQVYRRLVQRSLQIVSGASDYSLRRPSYTSQIVAGYIGPGLVDIQPNIVVYEDTSASMGQPQLHQARSECYAMMRKLGIDEVTLIQGDAAVSHCQRVRLKDLPKIDYTGRGGTNFSPLFAFIQKKLPRTNLVIVYSDGDGPAPAKAPLGYEVIWCIVRTPHARRPARWGHLVVCDKNQKILDPY